MIHVGAATLVRITVLVGAFSIAPLLGDDASAQSPGAAKRWEPISNLGFAPPVVGARDLVLDEARNRLLIYTREALWALDLETGNWASIVPQFHPPVAEEARSFATERLVLDPVLDRLYLTYGRDSYRGWSIQARTYTLRFDFLQWGLLASNGPSNHAPVVFDVAARRLFTFGGLLGAATNADTRMITLVPTALWVAVFTPVLPPSRMDAAACFDATRSRMWMWGGTQANGAPLTNESPGTMWAYEHDPAPAWQVIASSAPADAPTGGPITHDPVRDRLLRVAPNGGLWSFAIAPGGLSGTWSLTTSEPDLVPDGVPSAQVYDRKGDRLLALFGDRVWSLRLSLPDPAPDEGVADEAIVVRPRRDGFAVRLVLATGGDARVDVFDVRGRRVATVDGGTLGAGSATLDVPMHGRPAGVYFVRAKVGPATTAARRVVFTP